MDGVSFIVLLVYVFFLQRLLKCSRSSRYHICRSFCGVFRTGKEHLRLMAGSILMIAHYIGVGRMTSG